MTKEERIERLEKRAEELEQRRQVFETEDEVPKIEPTETTAEIDGT